MLKSLHRRWPSQRSGKNWDKVSESLLVTLENNDSQEVVEEKENKICKETKKKIKFIMKLKKKKKKYCYLSDIKTS